MLKTYLLMFSKNSNLITLDPTRSSSVELEFNPMKNLLTSSTANLDPSLNVTKIKIKSDVWIDYLTYKNNESI